MVEDMLVLLMGKYGTDNKSEAVRLAIKQSKLVYLNVNENKFVMNALLPQLAAIAEEREYLFLFTDVKKNNDSEQNSYFNNALSSAFLLDNIAEFAGERGQKTIFGSMDVKSLKRIMQDVKKALATTMR